MLPAPSRPEPGKIADDGPDAGYDQDVIAVGPELGRHLVESDRKGDPLEEAEDYEDPEEAPGPEHIRDDPQSLPCLPARDCVAVWAHGWVRSLLFLFLYIPLWHCDCWLCSVLDCCFGAG